MNQNRYNQTACELFVEKHNIKQRLSLKYHLTSVRFVFNNSILVENSKMKRYTPRELMISPFISMCSFYYIEYLIRENLDYIADIGCGMNFFKDTLPVRVHGIDGVGNYDEQAYFDEIFVKNHENFYEAAISIDALHFVSITQFKNRIMEFYKVIKPGGRAYLAMNAARLIDHTNKPTLDKIFGIDQQPKQIKDYILAELETLPINFLVVDCLIDEVYDECIDGNIRLVFEK